MLSGFVPTLSEVEDDELASDVVEEAQTQDIVISVPSKYCAAATSCKTI